MAINLDPLVGITIGNDISSSVSNLRPESLASPDDKTTLTANQGAKDAFLNSQQTALRFREKITSAGDFLASACMELREADARNAARLEGGIAAPGVMGPEL